MTDRYLEQAILLGNRKSLVGIVTLPHKAVAAHDRPTVVILNAGIIHRVGPNRISVNLARALASAGTCAVRFDLSGIGDSVSRPDGLPPLEASLADIKDVIDSLERSRGVSSIVLLGLCSGADHAVVYSGSDPRVVGLVLLDPSIPRTTRFFFNHYLRRLGSGEAWLNIIRGNSPVWRLLKSRVRAAPQEDQDVGRPNLESREVRSFLEGKYRNSLERGTKFLAVFTEGLLVRHNYRNQLLDAFPNLTFGRHLMLEYFKTADHEFTAEAERSRLVELVVRWAATTAFAPPNADMPARSEGFDQVSSAGSDK